jgi:hypothetical protein
VAKGNPKNLKKTVFWRTKPAKTFKKNRKMMVNIHRKFAKNMQKGAVQERQASQERRRRHNSGGGGRGPGAAGGSSRGWPEAAGAGRKQQKAGRKQQMAGRKQPTS